MAPYSHIYIATQVLDSTSWQVVLGAVTPDIGIVLAGTPGFEWKIGDGIDTARKILSTTRKSYPELEPFSLSYALHCAGFHGSDYYSDGLQQDGYAYVLGEPLIPKIANLLGIDEEQATIFSHNFIELAHDYLICKEYPQLDKLLTESSNRKNVEQINRVLHQVTGYNETFYLNALFSLLSSDQKICSEDAEIRLSYVNDALEKFIGKAVNGKQTLRIINEAEEIVTATGLKNIYEARDDLKRNFYKYIKAYE